MGLASEPRLGWSHPVAEPQPACQLGGASCRWDEGRRQWVVVDGLDGEVLAGFDERPDALRVREQVRRTLQRVWI